MEGREVPQGWLITKLGEVLDEIVGGGTPSKNVPEYFQGSIPLMTVKDMRNPRPTETGFNITQEALSDSSSKVVPADTVIIATRMGLGKVVRPRMATAINQDLKALFPSDALDKSFLENWLISIATQIEAMGTGTTVKGVRLNEIRELRIPLAPLNEQRRIVEKIETLFARLDKGEEALRDVQKLLARYRQSVLKAAVTGQLTADWRAENAHRLEHGRDLLDRILQTRRETWGGRGKYKDPTAPDTTDLPELPEGWVWASVGAFGDVKGGKRLPKGHSYSAEPTEYPYLRVIDFDDYGITQENLKYLKAATAAAIGRYTISDSDTYISIAGTIGVVGIVPPELSGANLTENAAKICNLAGVLPKFMAYWLSSPDGADEIRRRTIATTQPKLALFRISDIPAPVVNLAEQSEIVDLLDEIFARTTKLKEWCQTELARSAALRQSILKDAFAGRLVPQDPTDEPAAALLARIKETRAAAPGKTRRKARA